MGLSSLASQHSVDLDQRDKGSNSSEDTELLTMCWNQNFERFAVGTSCGFRVYTCNPLKEISRENFDMEDKFNRQLKRSGFGIVEMLFYSHIFALVGGGANPHGPLNKVMIWDSSLRKFTSELPGKSAVIAVRLRQDSIIVVLEHEIRVCDFKSLKVVQHIETAANPKGLCCVSYQPKEYVLACPGLLQGQVRVEHHGLKKVKVIDAHNSDVACLALALDGLIFATASIKGTVIRIFNTRDGTRLQEVRRGAERAEIYSIAFSLCLQWVVVSSDKGTIHTFNLRVRESLEIGSDSNTGEFWHFPTPQNAVVSPNAGANPRSSLSFMKGILPRYFSSEWSFAQFHLPEVTRYSAAFGADNNIIIIGLDGSYYRCSFDPMNGGEMVQQEFVQFFKP